MRNYYATAMVLTLALLGSASAQASAQNDLQRAKMMMKGCQGVDIDECVVRKFKDTPEASNIRGKIVYQSYCVLCHGVSGLGDGRAAKIHNPKPSNLTASLLPKEYLTMIIRKGGEAMGRSPTMPPWGEQLTDEQVRDLINFLVTIRTKTP